MRKAVLTFTTMLFVIGTIGSNIGPALVDNLLDWLTVSL
jgi:energy-converting hydrogenase Eha subunit E